MNHIPSYPSVYAIGHRMIQGIFSGPVIVEEKVDGSQFSFGVINGEIVCRSKGKDLIIDSPEKMFIPAVDIVKSKASILKPGYFYRCEYLRTNKHNALCYDRTPRDFLVVFDIGREGENYMTWKEKAEEAERIGLEVVPILFSGTIDSPSIFNDMLNRISFLGGAKIEGVVVKNYDLFLGDKKIAVGKYVSEQFKEIANVSWKQSNPGKKEILEIMIDKWI